MRLCRGGHANILVNADINLFALSIGSGYGISGGNSNYKTWSVWDVRIRNAQPLALAPGAICYHYATADAQIGNHNPSYTSENNHDTSFDCDNRVLSIMCKWKRPFWGTDCWRATKSLSSAQAV